MRTPYIESQKWLPWQHPLEPRNRLCLHRIVWPRKSSPRIKQRIASYHSTKVIAHQKAKGGCHGNVPQHLWTPIQHMISTAHPSPQPKRHPYRFSRLCTDDRRVSLYFTMGRPFSPKICPFPWGDLDLHLIHGSRAHPSPQPKRQLRRCSRFCRAH